MLPSGTACGRKSCWASWPTYRRWRGEALARPDPPERLRFFFLLHPRHQILLGALRVRLDDFLQPRQIGVHERRKQLFMLLQHLLHPELGEAEFGAQCTQEVDIALVDAEQVQAVGIIEDQRVEFPV